jgi:hypothetical protein
MAALISPGRPFLGRPIPRANSPRSRIAETDGRCYTKEGSASPAVGEGDARAAVRNREECSSGARSEAGGEESHKENERKVTMFPEFQPRIDYPFPMIVPPETTSGPSVVRRETMIECRNRILAQIQTQFETEYWPRILPLIDPEAQMLEDLHKLE